MNFEEYLTSPLYQPSESRLLISEKLKEIVQTYAIGKTPGVNNILVRII